ncbi:hypothetical protein TWF506_000829 [Arthrobotrys conoides]|uniref:Uncharacterized protein n=1 Tax=Arthrobotrys conoides TaxID=74498 RepID=A0AAN8RXX2_9PEZI
MRNLTLKRKYYWTLIDLTALVNFARRTKGPEFEEDLKLRHLTIEVYPPYINPIGMLSRLPRHPGNVDVMTLTKFYQILQVGFQSYTAEMKLSDDHRGLFAAAVPLLRELRRIDIVGPGHHEKIPTKVVLSHYKKFILVAFQDSPNYRNSSVYQRQIERQFLDFYRLYAASYVLPDGTTTRVYPDTNLPSAVLNHVLSSLTSFMAHKSKLTELNFCRTNRRLGFIPGRWFHGDARSSNYTKMDFYQPLMARLSTLMVHLQKPPIVNSSKLELSIQQVLTCQASFAGFLRRLNQLKGLCLSFDGITWANGMTLPSEEYLPYVSSVKLDALSAEEGHLKFLRNVQFDTLAFKSVDIIKFLVDRKGTLRVVSLVNCVLQAPRQVWWNVFTVLESLSLSYFHYDSTDGRMTIKKDEYGISYSPSAISWFRVIGNIATEKHHCELLPKGHDAYVMQVLNDPSWCVNYQKAIKAVRVLESIIILGHPARTALEDYVQQKYEPQHPGCDIPCRPPRGQWERGPRVYYKVVPINPYVVAYTLEAMKRIKDAGFDYDDPIIALPPYEGVDG